MALAVHRRVKPVASKICAAEWDRRDLNLHHNKLNDMTHHIDVSPPKTYYYSLNRSKREQQMEEKYSRMEKENQMLLSKMHWIMSHPSPTLDHNSEVFQYSHDAQGRPRSLNSVSRKKELRRIMADNQSILKRIQTRKAFYNRKEWDDHASAHDTYLENLREKPIPRLHSAPGRRRRVKAQLAPLSPQPGGVAAIESKTEGKHRIGGGSNAFAATTPLPATATSPPAVPGGSASLKNAFAKEGRRIDGHYVIVYVDELPAPDDALYFRTYDVDAGTEDGVKVPWTVINTLVTDEGLLTVARREELATSLLPRLRFKEGALSFDTSGDAVANGETKEAKKISVEEANKLAPASAPTASSSPAAEPEPTHSITVAPPAHEAKSAAAPAPAASSTTSRPGTTSGLAPPAGRPTTSASPRNEYADDAFDDPTPQPTPMLHNRTASNTAATAPTSPPLAAPTQAAAPLPVPTTTTNDIPPPSTAAAATPVVADPPKHEPKEEKVDKVEPKKDEPKHDEPKQPSAPASAAASPRKVEAAPAPAAAASVEAPKDDKPKDEPKKDEPKEDAPKSPGGEYEDDFS